MTVARTFEHPLQDPVICPEGVDDDLNSHFQLVVPEHADGLIQLD